MKYLRMKEGEELCEVKDKVLAQEGTLGQELDSSILVGPFLLRVFHNSVVRNVGYWLCLRPSFFPLDQLLNCSWEFSLTLSVRRCWVNLQNSNTKCLLLDQLRECSCKCLDPLRRTVAAGCGE